ncbi:Mono(2-hydroxyethyl) terephthalate hydrolase [Rhodococcus fascians]|uniref:tannase/feruloyl esterase family alpha/beta hydrolase n=1 Tax=Rhodococcoides fascians TaxID=1828 RepID=UPI001427EB98|nr:Mono(2-hydroxyethyl) terephthalate hydrolase [Rhodococcus fascians]
MPLSAGNMRPDLRRWVNHDEPRHTLGDARNLEIEALNASITDLGNVAVTSVNVNTSGVFESPQGFVTDLPDFVDVRVSITSGQGHEAHVYLWCPLDWNQRFLGVGGGGNRTLPQWLASEAMTSPTLRDGIRNGYAVACTDGANRDERFAAWGLNIDTGEIDVDLADNWHVRSTHEMAVVGKRLVERIYGSPPQYAYMMGASGGGRQTLVQAREHPEDFDGYWADCPAINWTRLHMAQMWPPLVMKELSNPVPLAKMEAFRHAAINAHDAQNGLVDGTIARSDFPSWDARLLVGSSTVAGLITERDAEVMNRIWEGPRTLHGDWLWYGPPIDSECAGGGPLSLGLANTASINGVLTPIPFLIATDWIGSWILRDPSWDWTTLTLEQYGELFARSVREFAAYNASDPDYSEFVALGKKLIISHGTADEMIPAQGTVNFYDAIRENLGGGVTDEHFRLYLCPGDVHATLYGDGPGLSLAAGMQALVAWVEGGDAPDILSAVRAHPRTDEVVMTRPIAPYPLSGNYIGGDPAAPESYSFS